MYQVVLRLLDICMFRAGPQDLPASPWLLKLLFAAYIGVGVLAGRLLGSVPKAFAEAMFDASILGLVLFVFLNWRGLAVRFVQVYSAALGCGTVINTLALPLIYGIAAAQASGGVSIELALIWVAILGWDIAVFAHILRHAFNISLGRGFMFSVIYVVAYYQLASALFLEAS
jgi:hypothetical protein